MVAKRRHTQETGAEIQDDANEVKTKRIRDNLQDFDAAGGKTVRIYNAAENLVQQDVAIDAMQKSMLEDEDAEWQAIRLEHKAADEAFKEAINKGDEVAIQKARHMSRKAKKKGLEKELAVKTTARKPGCKAKKSKAEEDIEEMNQLYEALILRENPPTPFPEYTELAMLSQCKKRRIKVDSVDVWLTWPQCRVCGTRRSDEEQLSKHWRFHHHFGAKGSAKREKIKAELRPYLQSLSGSYSPAPLLTNELDNQDTSSTNRCSTPPLMIEQEIPDDEFDNGLLPQDDLGQTYGEIANDSFCPSFPDTSVAQAFPHNYSNATYSPDSVHLNTNFVYGMPPSEAYGKACESGVHTTSHALTLSAANETKAPTVFNNYAKENCRSRSAQLPTIKLEEPDNSAKDAFLLPRISDMEAPIVAHNHPTSLEDSTCTRRFPNAR